MFRQNACLEEKMLDQSIKHPFTTVNHRGTTHDVCIVGAGVAGSALALYLGKQNLNVCIIEKDLSEQDRIVGELLQPSGVRLLHKMGLQDALKGFDAQTVYGYALFYNKEKLQIPYSVEQNSTVEGKSFRHGKFIQKLHQMFESYPGINVIEGTATKFLNEKDTIEGVYYKSKDGKEEKIIKARLTIISDGCFSKLRGYLSSASTHISGYFLGMILKDCQLPFPGHGHVIMADTSPFLCYSISSTETRVLVDFPGSSPPRKGNALKQYLREITGAQVPDSIKSSFMEAVEEGKFKTMPNFRLHAQPIFRKGAVMLGDALNIRHPLTGGGMTVALTDVYHLGNILREKSSFENDESLYKSIQKFYAQRYQHNGAINVLADALYHVMRAPELKKACYNYLKRGGKYAEGPISILSGISRSKKLLAKHFFSVAFHGAKNEIGPFPTITKIRQSYRMLNDATHIIRPLLLKEKPDIGTKILLKGSNIVFPKAPSSVEEPDVKPLRMKG